MTDEELVKGLRQNALWVTTHEAADRIEELERENERLRRTIDAAAKLGRIIGFLSYDEARISAFLEDCGPDLIDRARATLAQIEGGKKDE